MKRRARVVVLAVIPGLVLLLALVWLCRPRPRRAAETPPPPVAVAPDSGETGGQKLLLDTFSPTGRPGWHLDLGEVVVGADRVVRGSGITARFFGTDPPATLTASAIVCRPERAQLLFRGDVSLQGPGFALNAPELIWDDRSRSFSIEGRYVLTQGKTVLRGERLWADAAFQEVRALGAVKLEMTSDGGGMR